MTATKEDTNDKTTKTTTTDDDTLTKDDGEKKTKQAKLMNQYPVESDPTKWPEAWLMRRGIDKASDDLTLPQRRDPNVPVTVPELQQLGIAYWHMPDTTNYTYPTYAVPWDPKDAVDPKLQALRDDRGYSYADVITIHPDHLPEFDKKIAMFLEEHIHDAEEIRYILGGSGYFDVRNLDDDWVRIHVKTGDLITLPEGIYHRFTCDDQKYIHAMRLFIGQPIWTPFNRPQETHPSRQYYIQEFLQEKQQQQQPSTTKNVDNDNGKEEKKEEPVQDEAATATTK